MTNRKLLIAGGGTGGHVFAAIEIAKQWKHGSVLFVGSTDGMEAQLVPKENFCLITLKIGKLNRVSIWQKFLTLLTLPWIFLRCAWILYQFRPDVVLGVGGYASGPIVLMAQLLFFKTVILEQNAVSGFTNRILSRTADYVLQGMPITTTHPKYKVVGNPVRHWSISSFSRKNGFHILVLGGSQGSVGLNTLIVETQKIFTLSQVVWVHQTGLKDYERIKAMQLPQVQVVAFIQDMQHAYQQADLVIARAGALTIAELAAMQKASILIPLPTAADNHQEKNALLLEQKNACIVFLQSDSADMLAKKIYSLHSNSEQRKILQQNISHFYYPNAAQSCCQHLYELIKKK